MSRVRPPLAAAPGALALALALAGCEAGAPAGEGAARLRSQYHLFGFEQDFGYAQAVKVGRSLYISATFPVDPQGRLVGAGDLAVQLEAAYANLGRTLAANGADFDNVVREVIYTTDMDALLEAAELRFTRYDRSALPSISWLEVERLADPGFLVAIEATVELP